MFRRSLIQCSIFAFVFGLCSSAFALDYGDVTAVRDRTNKSALILTINFKSVTLSDNASLGIPATSISSSQVQQAFANHIDLCIATSATQTSCGETDKKVKYAIGRQPLPQTGIYISETQLANFVENGTTVVTDVADPTINAYSSQILITDNAAEIPVGTKILIRLYPDKVSSNGNKDKIDVVAKLGSGVKDVVEVTGAITTPVSISATWNNKAAVSLEDGTTGIPNGVIGALFSGINSTENVSFNAQTYVADPTTMTPETAACTVVPEGLETDAPTCSVTCAPADVPVSFNLNSLASAGIRTSVVNNLATTSILGFGGLTLAGGPYAIVLQYLPEGTKFSCAVANVSDAATLSQLNGGPAPSSGDPSCFIATAAYGSSLDPHIDVLRWFRDSYLLKSSPGKAFVRLYYRHSPPVANWISEHPWARTATRAALWTPVLFLEMLRDHRWMAISILLALGIAFFMRRRLA
ncbi:MAG: hypothetical protein EOP07_15595 [Proteobacteria bacterium]|nr:MAG: hypothetical protein EOP07_15595 [Pseudomonadota bacterium]